MKDEREHLPEHDESLWWLAAGPTVWFAHFMLSYVSAAVVCAKFPAWVHGVRGAIAICTLLALLAIGVIAWRGWRRHRFGNARLPHDDTREDRHRFLGFATLLLCVPSFIAVVYVALVPVFIGDCR